MSAFQISAFRLALGVAPLAWLWFVLLNDLRVEWTVNPQYGYGWAVPFLCLFLLARSARRKAEGEKQKTENSNKFQLSAFSLQLLFVLFALLYAPTRLIQQANPGWRLVSWALAIEVIGLTLCALRLALGTRRVQLSIFSFQFFTFIFPLAFFLVAVPWPTLLEGPLIQALTRVDVSATCELAGWFGIPAMAHGNVIEVATGQVGIDEACSGIRSFQATLMISLFLGEYYALGVWRRGLCILAGFALAVLLNLARQTVLVWVAASKGVPAIAEWHDPTGVIILLGCFTVLWGVGHWLASKNQTPNTRHRTPEDGKNEKRENIQQPTSDLQHPENGGQRAEAGVENGKEIRECKNIFQLSAFPISALALVAWLLLVETGVEGWYRFHEARLPAAVQWQVAWPVNNATFKNRDIAPDTRQILRFDDGRNTAWQEDELGWQVIFLHWKPGRAAVRLAQNHTPEVCLAAAGHRLSGGNDLQYLTVHGLKLPFRFYQLTDTAQPVFVAYCLWDDRAGTQNFETSFLTYGSRLAPVLAGQRNSGQRSLEIALTGANDPAQAQAAVQQLLEKIISPIR